MNNVLEFIDTADMSTMNKEEHHGVTDVEWDPTGRFITSAVSFWTQKVGPSWPQENSGVYNYVCVYVICCVILYIQLYL